MNILFIIADQWRSECLSALGHPHVKTPNLDALAADQPLAYLLTLRIKAVDFVLDIKLRVAWGEIGYFLSLRKQLLEVGSQQLIYLRFCQIAPAHYCRD